MAWVGSGLLETACHDVPVVMTSARRTTCRITRPGQLPRGVAIFLYFLCNRLAPPCMSPRTGPGFLRVKPENVLQQPPTIKNTIMAVTPSKDYKRREREQRKLDKRMAREAAKAQEIEAQQLAAQAAAAEAEVSDEEAMQAKLEAEFEAELAAERDSQRVA